MAFYCIDYTNGSNITGDGTPVAPWQTIAHGETLINGGAGYITGDEMRIAGSTMSLTPVGTCQYTSYSTSTGMTVTTNADLTGSISVGDMVQVGTSSDQGALDAAVEVLSITSTTMLLGIYTSNLFYAATSYNIYKVEGAVAFPVNGFSTVFDSINTTGQSFTPYNDDVLISGGWDPANFTSKTAYGRTVFQRTGTYQPTRPNNYGSVYNSANSNGFKFANFTANRSYFFTQASSASTNGHNYENMVTVQAFDYFLGVRPPGTQLITNCQGTSASENADLFGDTGSEWNVNGFKWVYGRHYSGWFPIHDQESGDANWSNITVDILANLNVELIARTRINMDWSTLTINEEPGRTGDLIIYNRLGDFNVAPPTISLPDSIMSLVTYLYATQNYGANLQISSLSNLLDLANGQGYLRGAAPTPKVIASADGLTYDWTSTDGFCVLNNIDNATGENALQYYSRAGGINAPLIGVAGRPGDTLEVQVTAKLVGATSSTTPSLKVGANSSVSTSRVAMTSDIDWSYPPLISGTSYNNSTYTTLTWSGPAPQYSNDLSNHSYNLSLDITLAAGESILIDDVTWTVS